MLKIPFYQDENKHQSGFWKKNAVTNQCKDSERNIYLLNTEKGTPKENPKQKLQIFLHLLLKPIFNLEETALLQNCPGKILKKNGKWHDKLFPEIAFPFHLFKRLIWKKKE